MQPSLAALFMVCALIAGAGRSGSAVLAVDQSPGSVRLPGHVLPALARASRVAATSHAASAEGQSLTLTVVLNRRDEKGFQKYLADVENPASPNHLRFLTQQQLLDRYGPTQQSYDAVLTWLTSQGFSLSEGSANRLTLTVKGTRAQAEQAFQVDIGDYRLDGRSFYASDQNPALPTSLASDVQAVIGLSDLARLTNIEDAALNSKYQGPCTKLAFWSVSGRKLFNPIIFWFCLIAASLGLQNAGSGGAGSGHAATVPSPQAARTAPTGAGQKIGLLEFDTFHPSDVGDWMALAGLPSPLARLSTVDVNGGVASPGPLEPEVLLDIDSVAFVAPGATYTVYDAPNGSTSFQTLFNAIINDPSGAPTVISNSWTYCEGETSSADAQSIDSILANAAASGISVLNATGDTGSSCDGSPNSPAVPADSPHATAVGGTSPTPGAALNYGGESWWNGANNTPPAGQGGFGESAFFTRPSYQDGVTSSARRTTPDLAASADPFVGLPICQADAGGCPAGAIYGGTSKAAPEWAGYVADLNQQLGHNLGFLNTSLYPLANTQAFHSAASMGSDFAHVGLGSPNLDAIDLALSDQNVGAVSATASTMLALVPLLNGVPADGATAAIVQVNLFDANGNIVSGKNVGLSANTGSHAVVSAASGPSSPNDGSVTFSVTDATAESVTFTAIDQSDNNLPLQQAVAVNFLAPPATTGGMSAIPTSVALNGSSTVRVVLRGVQGEVTPGKTVTLSQGSGHSTITATGAMPGVTDSTGTATFSVTDTVNEVVTYTATDVTDAGFSPSASATVTFGSGSGDVPCNQPPSGTPTASNGFSFTTFASGFVVGGSCPGASGPLGLAFDSSGNLFVVDGTAGNIYTFGPQGGTATTPINATPISGCLLGITFSKDGRLYGTNRCNNDVVELSPTTGAVLREVANNITAENGIATDPLSGDLFVTIGPGQAVMRISNFSTGTDTATVKQYASPFDSDGITFTPDGTWMFVAGNGAGVTVIGGTGSSQPASVTQIVPGGFPGNFAPDGIALAANPSNPANPPYVVANQNLGVITKFDLSWSGGNPPTVSSQENIFTGGSRGDFVAVGPDGCLYATQTYSVIKLTKSDGTCTFNASGVLPELSLTPSTVSPNPATGATATLTATLSNVASPQGTPISFTVSGANPQTKLVDADASGQATVTYTGAHTGSDTVTASATIGSGAQAASVSSAPASVTWVAGKDVTFTDLNTSPTSGAAGVAATLTAHLTDESQTPPAALPNQPLTISLGSQSCPATTDTTGRGSCQITPNGPPGSYSLVGTYAGDSQHAPSNATETFVVRSLLPASLSYTGAGTAGWQGNAAVAAMLTDTTDGGGLAGHSISFTLGSGGGAQSCEGTTDGTGTAHCTISGVNQPTGATTIAASFAGDSTAAEANTSAPFLICGQGDVNCSTAVDATDALCVLRLVAQLPGTNACPLPAPGNPDVNNDAAQDGPAGADATDALCILRHVANLAGTMACPPWGSQPPGAGPAASRGAAAARSAALPAASARLSLQPAEIGSGVGRLPPVNLQVDLKSGALGSWTVDIAYDPAAVTVAGCAAAAAAACNSNFRPGIVRVTGASAGGLSGNQTLATITLERKGGSAASVLHVADAELTDSAGAPLPLGGASQPSPTE